MKSYQAYLFDFDYTLADSSKGIVMCYRNVLERHVLIEKHLAFLQFYQALYYYKSA
jgi:phosphoglycolate phosphatase-like HAD superfamily hydrolase